MNARIARGAAQTLLIAGGVLAAAATASAGLISYSVDSTDPFGAESAFLNGAGFHVTETFEGETVSEQSGGLTGTSVGDFTVTGSPGDTSGDCLGGCDNLWVLDQQTSHFNGRYDTTDGDGDDNNNEAGHWLDSNDVAAFQWSIGGSLPSVNALGFFLMDPADQGAQMSITFSDGSEEFVSLNNQLSGSLFYVSAIADADITNATVTFQNDDGDTAGDGFGIDNVTVAHVPEPATLGLFGAGLVGLGFASRRRRSL